jgi:hypothetical protein
MALPLRPVHNLSFFLSFFTWQSCIECQAGIRTTAADTCDAASGAPGWTMEAAVLLLVCGRLRSVHLNKPHCGWAGHYCSRRFRTCAVALPAQLPPLPPAAIQRQGDSRGVLCSSTAISRSMQSLRDHSYLAEHHCFAKICTYSLHQLNCQALVQVLPRGRTVSLPVGRTSGCRTAAS